MKAKSKTILLDGGMGQELVRRGAKWQYGDWSVSALYETPEMVSAVHEDYIDAGADVITTNTYGTTRTRLRHAGIEDRFEELIHAGGKIAIKAREAKQADHLKIAASLPPLEASYISEFNLSFDEMVKEYREMMTLLAPYVDIYLGETFSTALEACAFMTAAQGMDKPTWLSLTLQDHGSTSLRGDETLQDVIASVRDFAPDALLINCCTPDSIQAALPILQNTGLPFGGYANGFTEVTTDAAQIESVVAGLSARRNLLPDVYANHVQQWISAGASIVGGCCEVGPKHIAKLRTTINAQVTSTQ